MILHFYTTTITLTNYYCSTYDWTLVIFLIDLFGNPQKDLPIFPKNEIIGNMGKISYGFRTSLLLLGSASEAFPEPSLLLPKTELTQLPLIMIVCPAHASAGISTRPNNPARLIRYILLNFTIFMQSFRIFRFPQRQRPGLITIFRPFTQFLTRNTTKNAADFDMLNLCIGNQFAPSPK